jgi:hypothetical protein
LTISTNDRNKTTDASAISTEETSDDNPTTAITDINRTTDASAISTEETSDDNSTTGISTISTEEISDSGSAGLNGGAILNDNSNISTTLATNMMAEDKLYIGLGYNRFAISTNDTAARHKTTGASAISTEETSDGGSTVGLRGGVILNNNSKINFSYFSGKEKDSELFKTTVMAISYDYSFNNSGAREGWYLGAGFSSVKTEIVDNPLKTSTSESGTGLLLRGGYEYQINDNILFDIGFNIHTSKQKQKYNNKIYDNTARSTTTTVSNLNLSVNYIF